MSRSETPLTEDIIVRLFSFLPLGLFFQLPPRQKRATQTEDLGSIYELSVCGHGLTHIRCLSACPRLRALDLSCNKIERIEGLSANPDLRDLRLFNNRISGSLEASSFTQSKELQRLLLQMNRIECLGEKAFSGLRKLRFLRLDHNRLTSIANLEGCSASLETLDLTNNPLKSLQGLLAMPKLTELRASFTDLGNSDVAIIARCCPGLVELHLASTAVSKLEPLSSLRRLEVLSLDGCPVPGADQSFRKLPSLRELRLRGCKGVTDVSFFPELFPSLEVLDVTGCSIGAIESVLALRKIGTLEELFIAANPVSSPQPDAFAWKISEQLTSLRVLNDMAVRRDPFGKGPVVEPLQGTRPGTAASATSAPEQVGGQQALSRPSTASAPVVLATSSRPGTASSRVASVLGTPWTTPREGQRASTPSAVPGPPIQVAAPVMAPANSAALLSARVMTPQEASKMFVSSAEILGVSTRIQEFRASLTSASGSRPPSRLKPIERRPGSIEKPIESPPNRRVPPKLEAVEPRKETLPTTAAGAPPKRPKQMAGKTAKRAYQNPSKLSASEKPVAPEKPAPVPPSQQDRAEAATPEQAPKPEAQEIKSSSGVDAPRSVEGDAEDDAGRQEDDRSAHRRGPPRSWEQLGYHRFRVPSRSSTSRRHQRQPVMP